MKNKHQKITNIIKYREKYTTQKKQINSEFTENNLKRKQKLKPDNKTQTHTATQTKPNHHKKWMPPLKLANNQKKKQEKKKQK